VDWGGGFGLNWYGLNWTDIIINVTVLAILPGLLGAFGGHLAAEGVQDKKRRGRIKLIFWGMCAVWVCATFYQQFRASEADLDRGTKDVWAEALLSTKFPVPSVPTMTASTRTTAKAKMEFIFYGGGVVGEPVSEIALPFKDGGISLTFSTRVVGNVVPIDGSLWIRICNECNFIGNMAGFLEDKDDPHVRSIPFRLLYTGRVELPRMTAHVGFPAGAPTVPVGFFYACVNCAPLDTTKLQPLTVKVVYP
jgi:hypothetical protein